MSRYKVLHDHPFVDPHPSFANMFRSELEEYYTKGDPVFGKDGWYLDRNTGKAWIETLGHAWYHRDQKAERSQIEYEVRHATYTERPFSDTEIHALGLMLDRGLIHRNKASEIFMLHESFKFHRRLRVNSWKQRLEMKQRMAATKTKKARTTKKNSK